MNHAASTAVEPSYPCRTVAGVMRPAATTVEAHGHLAAAAYLMTRANQSALVVVDNAHRPVAIITERDVLRAVAHGADAEKTYVADWMNPHPRTVNPDTTVTEAARIMRDTAVRHLPVVSHARLVGMVAAGDIIDTLVGSVRLDRQLVSAARVAAHSSGVE
jgi:CBS domain-containing protein